MNIYLWGMIIALIVFLIIGMVVRKTVKNAEDFYVAGRQAPILLIAGSLIASYSSTGLFMGDAAQCYDGAFAPIVLFAGMQSAGYIIGAVFFGRYLRRSNALTIPEFFGKRFDSVAVRIIATLTAIVTMTVYLLSVIQGIATLMSVVAGISYNLAIIISAIVFTYIAVFSGSKGVLITDTLMASIFTFSLILGVLFIARNFGGWYASIAMVSQSTENSVVLSWKGRPEVLGVLYTNGCDGIIWGLTYGIVWMSVCMIGPWQASRYQMAKSEHVVIKSSYISAIGVFLLEFLAGMGAVIVLNGNSGMADSSQVLIWASMNIMPKVLGVVLLTGILSAGISSATTFLSLIGASVANDIIPIVMKNEKNRGQDDSSVSIKGGQVAMFIVAVIVLVIAVLNPPSLFWIMYLGGSIVASSWMPVAVASVFSSRITKLGAAMGMSVGFMCCFCLKLISALFGVNFPSYFDPTIIGIGMNVIAIIIGSCVSKVSDNEKRARNEMFIVPESEKNLDEVKSTIATAKWCMLLGIVFTGIIALLWVVPYYVYK